MKHYSAASGAVLRTEAEIVERLRGQLDGTEEARSALIRRLGVGQGTLSRILRGMAISDNVARALGYRRVTRFEKMS